MTQFWTPLSLKAGETAPEKLTRYLLPCLSQALYARRSHFAGPSDPGTPDAKTGFPHPH
ncbi:hypothetical protein [Pantoea stewartii]|uniref:hypothetical protein n=1 Tax=Pantoea stewartii TaxID=66269 RepID=UPI0012D82711|nr:hypothetical protein [Pantoea stewartii]